MNLVIQFVRKKNHLLRVKQVSKNVAHQKDFLFKILFSGKWTHENKNFRGDIQKILETDAYVRLLLEEVIENC